MTFFIEDELHAETLGEFPTVDRALGELRRLVLIPWDDVPNRAPCTSWRTCGRNYEIAEYDTTAHPHKEVRRFQALVIDASGPRWSAGLSVAPVVGDSESSA